MAGDNRHRRGLPSGIVRNLCLSTAKSFSIRSSPYHLLHIRTDQIVSTHCWLDSEPSCRKQTMPMAMRGVLVLSELPIALEPGWQMRKQAELVPVDLITGDWLGGAAHNLQSSWKEEPSRTREYCAPEIDRGSTRGRSADIFSLGAVVLKVLMALHFPDQIQSLNSVLRPVPQSPSSYA